MLTRTKKKELVKAYNSIFNEAVCGILIDYRGTTVIDLTNLRKALHEDDSHLKILSNRIAKLAIKDSPFQGLNDELIGTRALVYNLKDGISLAKALCQYIAENEKGQLIGGVLVERGQGRLLQASEVEALSKLPSKEELLSKLVYLLNAPISRLAQTLNEIPTSLVRTLKAIAEKRN